MLPIETQVRALLRQVNLKPFDSDAIMGAVEIAIDDFSNRAPFVMAVDRTHGIKGQMEYILPSDSLEIIEVYYKDAAGVTLAASITSTSPPALSDELAVNEDVTDFGDSGTLQIENEQVTYRAKGSRKFTGITRGANGTAAAAHAQNVVVEEADAQYTLLNPLSSLATAQATPTWLSESNAPPSTFYTYGGVLGFDTRPDKTGCYNILIRHLIRPPALTRESDTIAGLMVTFRKAIIKYAASDLAMRLASDDASIAQAKEWRAEYLADVSEFRKRKHLYIRGNPGQLIPYTGRS